MRVSVASICTFRAPECMTAKNHREVVSAIALKRLCYGCALDSSTDTVSILYLAYSASPALYLAYRIFRLHVIRLNNILTKSDDPRVRILRLHVIRLNTIPSPYRRQLVRRHNEDLCRGLRWAAPAASSGDSCLATLMCASCSERASLRWAIE